MQVWHSLTATYYTTVTVLMSTFLECFACSIVDDANLLQNWVLIDQLSSLFMSKIVKWFLPSWMRERWSIQELLSLYMSAITHKTLPCSVSCFVSGPQYLYSDLPAYSEKEFIFLTIQVPLYRNTIQEFMYLYLKMHQIHLPRTSCQPSGPHRRSFVDQLREGRSGVCRHRQEPWWGLWSLLCCSHHS